MLAAAVAGDRSALGQLLKDHEPRLYNTCLRMVSNPDDAAQITQDTLVKIIKHIDRFRGDSRFSTWATRIAMNQAISHLRKRKLRQTVSLDASAHGPPDARDAGPTLGRQLADPREPGPDQRVEEGEMLEQLKAALGRLNDDFRAVIVLRDLRQMDYQQVAQTLDLPVGTVKSRLFRARLALRQEMTTPPEVFPRARDDSSKSPPEVFPRATGHPPEGRTSKDTPGKAPTRTDLPPLPQASDFKPPPSHPSPTPNPSLPDR